MELKDAFFDMGRLHEFLGAYRLKKYAAKLVAALKEACPHERVGWGFHIILDNGKSIGVMMVEPNGIKLGVEIFPMWPSKPYHRIARIYNEPKEEAGGTLLDMTE